MPGIEVTTPGAKPATPAPSQDVSRPSLLTALGRGFVHRCPRCGRGALFRAYLKPTPACGACGEPFDHIRADDAPPYFTIFVVGHVVVALILLVEMNYRPPMWLHMAIWPALTLALTLVLLPHIKGALVGLMWRLKLKGDEFQ
ncbi:MAG: DUF983 domain-containing protein [Alphaproteobacteria bacterium]|nr:DUF983 domain-containing protein [Alphaproteobacteria bacterium]